MSARTKESNGLSRFRATATLDREVDTGNPTLFDFFVTACEAVFGQMGGYVIRDEDSLKWQLSTAAKMAVRLSSGEGKTDIHVDARMFKFWYFATHILFYIIFWNLFAIVMRFLGVGRIDPLVVPGLFLLVSAIRFGSIGICLLILHLIFRSSRKRAFSTAFVTLVSAIESFLEIETNIDDPTAYRKSIIDVLPTVGRGPGMIDLHFSTNTKWRINPDMDEDGKDKLRNTICSAGFNEGFVDYHLESKTRKPVGFILRAGSKIQILLSPRSEGTQIDFWSDLSGFVPILTMLTTVGIVAVAGILIGYFHVIDYGATRRLGGLFESLFWYSLFFSVGLWNAVRAILLSLRKAKIKEGASRFVEMLEKTEETVEPENAAAKEIPEVREGEPERQTEVLDRESPQMEIDNRNRSIEELSEAERKEIAVWLKEKGERPEDYLEDKNTELDLSKANITDADLTHIRSLTNLQELDLSHNRITDIGLAYLRGMTDLRMLNLEQTLVTEDGLQQLIDCPNLNCLEVDQRKIKLMPVIRAGGAHLFSGIRILNLSDQNVTDDDLEYLREYSVLMLDLDMNQITGTGLRYLEGMTALKSLNIAFNPLNTEMLSHLKIHKSLEQLHIQNTNVDEEGILGLKRHLPWLSIWSDCELTGGFFFRLRMALYGVKGIIYKMFVKKGG